MNGILCFVYREKKGGQGYMRIRSCPCPSKKWVWLGKKKMNKTTRTKEQNFNENNDFTREMENQ